MRYWTALWAKGVWTRKWDGAKVCVVQNTDLRTFGWNHDPCQEGLNSFSRFENMVHEDRGLMKNLLQEALHCFLDAGMPEFLGASSGQGTDEGKVYRVGYYRWN